jgi:Ca-activated chloride channel family protein
MSELLPHLLRPFWLLILPLPVWLVWRLWHRRRQVGRWQRLLPPAFHAELLTRGRLRNSRLPWVLLGTGWLLACLALLGPSWQHLEQPSLRRADPLVVLLELTPAMLAGDLQPTRLEHAKRKLIDLLRARQDAQTAVVVFAGSAHVLVPLSNDLETTRNLLDVLKPELMPEPGHRADLAVALGLALLEQGSSGHGRLLLIGSSLDEAERNAIPALLAGSDAPLLMLGVGTAQGAPIAREDGSFFKDAQGAILIPRLDNRGLRRFAESMGARYQQSRLGDGDLEQLGLLDLRGGMLQQDDVTRLSAWLDQGYWLLLPLLLLAACAGRRGWLFCLPLLLIQPQPAHAFNLADLWWRPDQQGQRLLDAERPAEAAQYFRDLQWQGVALYQAGDYQGAAERFAQGSSAADHYNRGNALAHSDALEEAIEAYEQALALQPELSAALHNKTLVEQLLRQRQAQSSAQDEAAEQPRETPAEAPSAPPNSAGEPSPQTARQDERAADAEQQPPAAPTQPSRSDARANDSASDEPPPPAQPPLAEQNPAVRDPEREQAMQQWLRRIPDDPGELLRRKFLYEQRKRQDMTR